MASLRYVGQVCRPRASISAQLLMKNEKRLFVTSAKLLATSNEKGKEVGNSAPFGSPSPLSPSAPPPKEHGKVKVFLVTLLGKLMGYNSTTSTAIRVTSDMYDRCAEQADKEADFWYGECGLPRSYQTWFQITNLHIHLLLTRFRSMHTPSVAQAFSQELINHFFIDAESRMRLRFGVQTSRLVKGYMREMHTQQRGAILGMDEALSYSLVKETDRERYGDADAILATALWRNIWGAGGWGEGVGGVKRKVRGIDRFTEEEKKEREKRGKRGKEIDEEAEEGLPELAVDVGQSTLGSDQIKSSTQYPTDDLRFAIALQRLVRWYRYETVRLDGFEDEYFIEGGPVKVDVNDEERLFTRIR